MLTGDAEDLRALKVVRRVDLVNSFGRIYGKRIIIMGGGAQVGQVAIGAISEAVVVKETPVAVQFNTSTMQMNVDRKMLNDLPAMARNPPASV